MSNVRSKRTPATVWRRLVVPVLAAALMLPALPGSAHPSLEHHCPLGAVCLFEAPNYGHEMHWWFGDDGSYFWETYELSTDGHGHRVDNTASSVDNDGQQCGTRHFVSASYAGDHFWLALGNAIADMAEPWDESLSSHDWCGDRPHH